MGRNQQTQSVEKGSAEAGRLDFHANGLVACRPSEHRICDAKLPHVAGRIGEECTSGGARMGGRMIPRVVSPPEIITFPHKATPIPAGATNGSPHAEHQVPRPPRGEGIKGRTPPPAGASLPPPYRDGLTEPIRQNPPVLPGRRKRSRNFRGPPPASTDSLWAQKTIANLLVRSFEYQRGSLGASTAGGSSSKFRWPPQCCGGGFKADLRSANISS